MDERPLKVCPHEEFLNAKERRNSRGDLVAVLVRLLAVRCRALGLMLKPDRRDSLRSKDE
jgi:hypothetical protein